MRRIWTDRVIEAPATVLWDLLTDLEQWPAWGPSLRSAVLDGRFEAGATGRLQPVVGPTLPFEITDVRPGAGWAWRVSGFDATDHRVEPVGDDRCCVGFGVPPYLAPYLVVCAVALRRLETMATSGPARAA